MTLHFYPPCASAINNLKAETDVYGDPELINNSPETAPSNRRIKVLENKYNYNKVQSGTNTPPK